MAILSLGLLVEDLCFSYIWNPGKSPLLRKGNLTVRCHPTNNVPFICPDVSSEAGDVSKAAGDRERWEQAGTEDEPQQASDVKESAVGEIGEGKKEELDEEGVPIVRSRP